MGRGKSPAFGISPTSCQEISIVGLWLRDSGCNGTRRAPRLRGGGRLLGDGGELAFSPQRVQHKQHSGCALLTWGKQFVVARDVYRGMSGFLMQETDMSSPHPSTPLPPSFRRW